MIKIILTVNSVENFVGVTTDPPRALSTKQIIAILGGTQLNLIMDLVERKQDRLIDRLPEGSLDGKNGGRS